MPAVLLFRPLLSRLAIGAVALCMLSVSVIWIAGTYISSAGVETHPQTRAAAPPVRALPADSLALAFAALQASFVRDGIALSSEVALSNAVHHLLRAPGPVAVMWSEQSLVLAESRIEQLYTLFGIWGVPPDRVRFSTLAGTPEVEVQRLVVAAAEMPL